MRKLMVVVVLVLAFVVGCSTVGVKGDSTAPKPDKPKLTNAEISVILKESVRLIEANKCKAEFLSEKRGYIWSRCEDGSFRIFDVNKVVDDYLKQKSEGKSGK